jgi:predicted  nucleic acid-binding Zn-ribbon protein
MGTELVTIVDLQHTIDELKAADDLLAGIPDWMQTLHDEHTEQKSTIDALQIEVDEAESARRDAETEIGDLREKAKHFQEQIALVRNQREYGALLHEIDTAKRQISDIEEKAIGTMELQEEASKRLQEELDGFKDLDERYAAELDKWEAQKPGVAEEATKLRDRVAVLKEQVSAGRLALFERILDHREGNALALIREIDRGAKSPKIWCCGGCNYRVRPQIVVAIQTQGSIETCDSCKRILYIAEDKS